MKIKLIVDAVQWTGDNLNEIREFMSAGVDAAAYGFRTIRSAAGEPLLFVDGRDGGIVLIVEQFAWIVIDVRRNMYVLTNADIERLGK